MDVEVALASIREKIARINEPFNNGKSPDDDELARLAIELADQVDALDEWLSKGGALPKGWAR